jgi:5-methyltetrahydrofolate--homocysteine methyltransferase
VTLGPVTELIGRLEREGEFAEQLYVHGLGVQAAEGLAEWLHSEVRRQLDIPLDQGRRFPGVTPPAPINPSTRRSGACSTSSRSA